LISPQGLSSVIELPAYIPRCHAARSCSVETDRRPFRRLLRARRKRPCRRTTEQHDELAPHGHSLGARIAPYHIVEKPLCITAFLPTRLPVWVIFVRSSRSRRSRHVRFAPIASEPPHRSGGLFKPHKRLLRSCPLHFSGRLPQLFNAPFCALLIHKRLGNRENVC